MNQISHKTGRIETPVESLYSVSQVAKMLGMARATIKKKIHAGFIATTKDGLISETSLKNYINGK